MALNVNFKEMIGKVTIKYQTADGAKRFTTDICVCNALAAFIYKYKFDGVVHRELWSFFADEAHATRMAKGKNGKVFGNDDIAKVELNLAYKQAIPLARIFAKSGYKVEVYYKQLTK